MIFSLLVIGAIAWVLTGAVEDTIRAGRGDAPAGPRKGFRGYLDDRWAALADRHHTNHEAGLLSAGDSWAHRRHLARKKALALRGYKTNEDIARAAYHHRRRLGLIGQGIEPDTAPPPPGSPALKRPHRMMRDRNQSGNHKPATEKEKEGETTPQPESNDLDTIDVIGLTDLNPNSDDHQGTEENPKPTTDESTNEPEPDNNQGTPWTPFNEPTKEHTVTAGEINNPSDVKMFAAAMSNSLDTTTGTIDILNGLAAGLDERATDHAANALAAESAAAGMDRLGMSDAAAAARNLLEQQKQIQTAIQAIADALAAGSTTITNQVEAARPKVASIMRAYQAQLAVADTRSGVGRGNLAADTYLDGDS